MPTEDEVFILATHDEYNSFRISSLYLPLISTQRLYICNLNETHLIVWESKCQQCERKGR